MEPVSVPLSLRLTLCQAERLCDTPRHSKGVSEAPDNIPCITRSAIYHGTVAVPVGQSHRLLSDRFGTSD